MTVYIDSEFRCHVNQADGLTAAETDLFDGKCTAFVEGYRFVPAGQTWTREDGKVFSGEMAAPWKPFSELDAAQREYEREQLADMQNALELLGVDVNG